ncbi:MAG: hypothetical protein K2X66_01755 [Cyanobacteria bacterium]|nr:hypothetical protein [Cyanobacteriota bacterium]
MNLLLVQPFNKQILKFAFALSIFFCTFSSTFAEDRGITTVDGPGFKVETKRGWFGTSQKTYKDILGNTVVEKRDIFGRTKRETTILGKKTKSTSVLNGNENAVINGPNGKPLIERKKSFFKGQETHIHADGF